MYVYLFNFIRSSREFRDRNTGSFSNLIFDVAAGINEIAWNLAGKISRIEKSDGTILSYFYNAMGNRIGKSNFDGTNTNFIWYIRDASGNNMATYNRYNDQGLYIDEFTNYGSTRLGTFKPEWQYSITDQRVSYVNSVHPFYLQYPTGFKHYELTNNLGNALSTISDQKTPINNDSDPETDYFTAIVKTQQDYYPFGMMMPSRTYSLGGDYKFGFNGQERTDEISGKGNHNTAIIWEYDTRLGRRWNIDPKSGEFPWTSPYSTFFNNQISLIDPDGQEPIPDPRNGWQKFKDNFLNIFRKQDKLTTPKERYTVQFSRQYELLPPTQNDGSISKTLSDNRNPSVENPETVRAGFNFDVDVPGSNASINIYRKNILGKYTKVFSADGLAGKVSTPLFKSNRFLFANKNDGFKIELIYNQLPPPAPGVSTFVMPDGSTTTLRIATVFPDESINYKINADIKVTPARKQELDKRNFNNTSSDDDE